MNKSKEIFKNIEKEIVPLGKDGPCLLTVVNRSRFDSDLETAKQDANLTGIFKYLISYEYREPIKIDTF